MAIDGKKKYVGYVRVSTKHQDKTGLSEAAQKSAIEKFVAHHHGSEIIEFFYEVESGAKSMFDRPKLYDAIVMCRKEQATLIVLRLDRLYRDLLFMQIILNSGIEIVFTDFPMANRMVINILALVAEYEHKLIKERTRAALQVAKKNGKILGNPYIVMYDKNTSKARRTMALNYFSNPDMIGMMAGIDMLVKREPDPSWNAIVKQLAGMGYKTEKGNSYIPAKLKKKYELYKEFEEDIMKLAQFKSIKT